MSVVWLSQGEEDVPSSREWLAADECRRAEAMRYAKRRSDYLLGRWTAKQAVARVLGGRTEPVRLAAIEIRNVVDGPARGAPRVFADGRPAPLSISMTDRAGWGVCAVSEGEVALGCDLELVEPRSPAFVRDYLTAGERARLEAAASEDDARRLANLIWSAKESALKILRTGLRRDTRSVEVSVDDQPVTGGWCRLVVAAEEGPRFSGWWRRYGDFLLTLAAGSDVDPPCSLVDPPSLACAVPSHRWMAAPLAGRLPG
jgi:4'-phosphopantetheinyl transferase